MPTINGKYTPFPSMDERRAASQAAMDKRIKDSQLVNNAVLLISTGKFPTTDKGKLDALKFVVGMHSLIATEAWVKRHSCGKCRDEG